MALTERFAGASKSEPFAQYIDARTQAIYCESVSDPLGNVTDIAALAKVAHAHGLPLIVDNTVPSPHLRALNLFTRLVNIGRAKSLARQHHAQAVEPRRASQSWR